MEQQISLQKLPIEGFEIMMKNHCDRDETMLKYISITVIFLCYFKPCTWPNFILSDYLKFDIQAYYEVLREYCTLIERSLVYF